MKYYAVKKGYQTGIFMTWPETQKQVNGFKGAVHQSFNTKEEAENYLNDVSIPNPVKTKKGKTIKYKNGAYEPILKHFDVVVYTDGSSTNYVGGYGFVVLSMNQDLSVNLVHQSFDHIDGHCTNMAAELHAIHHALLYCQSYKNILIRSDSETSIKTFTQYIHVWKKNGYMTVKKEPVLNKDLIIQISELLDHMNVTFEHIESHVGEYYNEMADQLADKGVKK